MTPASKQQTNIVEGPPPRPMMTLSALQDAFKAVTDETASIFTARDLMQAPVRANLVKRHPMNDDAFFIETDQADWFYQVAFDHVLARKSGLYCVGNHRIGKTKAIAHAMERLQTDFPFMAFLAYDGERKPHQSKERFCADLLKCWGYALQRNQPADRTVERFLMTEAAKVGGRVCVVFIDEAQMLSVVHYRYLLEVWNVLRRHGCLLLTILVGQRSLDHTVTLTQELDHGAVVSRFFVKRYQMSGLHSDLELKKYLQAYDSTLTFPAGSQWPYTRFFLQKAYDSGFRLGDCAGELWPLLEEFVKAAKKTRPKIDGIGLALITDAIKHFLLDSMRDDSEEFKSSPTRWQEALLAASDKESLT